MVTGRVKESCGEIKNIYTGDTKLKKYSIYVHSHSDTILENCSKCWYLVFVEGQVNGFHRLGCRAMREDRS